MRLGGEEFLVIACGVADRMREQFAKAHLATCQKLTASRNSVAVTDAEDKAEEGGCEHVYKFTQRAIKNPTGFG